MDSTTGNATAGSGYPTFTEMVRELGIRPRLLYPVRLVSEVLGVKPSTLNDEIAAGRLRYHLPEGRKQGRLIRAEWVDEWLQAYSH